MSWLFLLTRGKHSCFHSMPRRSVRHHMFQGRYCQHANECRRIALSFRYRTLQKMDIGEQSRLSAILSLDTVVVFTIVSIAPFPCHYIYIRISIYIDIYIYVENYIELLSVGEVIRLRLHHVGTVSVVHESGYFASDSVPHWSQCRDMLRFFADGTNDRRFNVFLNENRRRNVVVLWRENIRLFTLQFTFYTSIRNLTLPHVAKRLTSRFFRRYFLLSPCGSWGSFILVR